MLVTTTVGADLPADLHTVTVQLTKVEARRLLAVLAESWDAGISDESKEVASDLEDLLSEAGIDSIY